MNILLLYSRTLLPNDGGIATISLTLVKCMRAEGHSVSILSISDMKKTGDSEFQYFLPNNGANAADNLSFSEELCKKKKIDLIINQVPLLKKFIVLLPELRRRTGVKVISCLHNPVMRQIWNFALRKEYILRKRRLFPIYFILKSFLAKSVLSLLYKFEYRRTYRDILSHSDRLVVLCEGMKNELLDMIGTKKGQEKIVVIPNFIETVHKVCNDSKEKSIIWCGTVDFDVKRVHLLLSLWKNLQDELPDWHLMILGNGSKMQEAKNIARELCLVRYSFEGRTSPDEYYRKAKILLVTSSFESFSLVTLEAMSYGIVPIVFNTFPAASMLIEDGENGYIVEDGEIADYVSAVKTVAVDEKLCQDMGEASVKKSRSFTSPVVYGYWHRLFQSLF